jgi:glycerate kinase
MDTNGQIVEALAPAHWSRIRSLGGKISPTFPPLFLACDVTNPLLGPEGAAAIYGPQKGLRREHVERMDLASHQMAKMLTQLSGQSFSLTEAPGAGAAGGSAFGLLSFAGGRMISGGELVSDWLNLSARIKAADLVFTGEGRLDRTSLQGKGPGLVIGKALEMGKKVHVFTGAVEPGLMIPCGVEVHVISPSHVPIAEALSQAESYLQESVSLAFANGGLEKEASFSRR